MCSGSTPSWCWTCTFAKPVNYLLVRVHPPAGMTVDPLKRPFVVVDPRAGHGPNRQLQGRQRTGRGDAGHAPPTSSAAPEPMPAGPSKTSCIPSGVPRESHRTAQASKASPASSATARGVGRVAGGGRRLNCSARSSSPVRRCRIGPAWKARTRCATPAAWPAAAG